MLRGSKKLKLTQDELKELLHYDPDTGVFTWKVSPTNNVKVGDVAGCRYPEGYIKVHFKGKPYRAHRLAFLYMTGEWPKDQVDHINHIRDDNRWRNLRDVSHQENHRNMTRQKNNTSGVTGVYWEKAKKKWCAQKIAGHKSAATTVIYDEPPEEEISDALSNLQK